MSFAAQLLALLLLEWQCGFLLGTAEVEQGPFAGARQNGIGLNPDVVAFAPNGIDFLFINVNRSIHRRQHMERQLHRARITATRWPATEVPVDSVDVTLGFQKAPGYPRPGTNQSRRQYAGTLSCRRSHTAAVAHLWSTGAPGSWHMVFEDDVVFPPTLFKEAQRFMQLVPDNWDVIRFDCEGVLRAHPAFYDVIAPSVFRVHWVQASLASASREHCKTQPKLRCWLCASTHAVLYRHEALPAVLRAVQDDADELEYDCLLTRAGKPRGPLHTYCIQLGMVNPWSTSFPSDRLGR